MELRHLRYYIAVAEALSFSRAATRLRLAQPSLSTQIRDLEAELDVRLLERDRNRVALTDAGEVFLREAKAVIARAEKAVARAREAAAGATGELRVASMGPITIKFLPACLSRMRAVSPHTLMSVVDTAPSQQLPEIHAGRLHVGIIPSGFASLSAAKGLARLRIIRSPLVIMVPAGHPLAGRKSARLKEFAGSTFLHIIMYGSDAQRMWTHEHCQRAGFTARFGGAAENADNLVSMVSAGAGVALIPEIAQRPESPGCIVLPLLDRNLDYELYAMYSEKHPSELRDTFLDVIAKECASLGPQFSLEGRGPAGKAPSSAAKVAKRA